MNNLNIVPFTNLGITQALQAMVLALLKVTPLTDNNGSVIGYRATLVCTQDQNEVVKSDGEIQTNVNGGAVFNVRVNSSKMPKINGMVMNVQLVNPQVHSVYGTTSRDSAYASVNISISADGISQGGE